MPSPSDSDEHDDGRDVRRGRGGGTDATGEVTMLLLASRDGDRRATERLFALVYDDLRALAGRHVRAARAGAGHAATSIVHEVFLRMARHGRLAFNDRAHFFAVASRAMRQIVIDEARSRQAQKRGGGRAPVDLDSLAETVAAAAVATPVEDLLALDRALEELATRDARLAETVEWHFFAGLTFAEIAEAREVSERTVLRDWRVARALLHDALEAGPPGS